jgi:hypothetical protein
MTGMNLTELAREIHEQNVQVGWWDDWPVKTDRHETAMMLVISEIAEAMEGHRKNLMDDHLPQYKMFDVEIADALIRLLDLAGAYEIEVIPNKEKYIKRAERWSKLSIPEQLYTFIVEYLTQMEDRQAAVKLGIFGIMALAVRNDIQIFTIMQEKRDYNAKRADHKRENRAADKGKKY